MGGMLSIKILRLISNCNSSIRSQHTNAEENGDLTIENQEKEGKNITETIVSCFDFGDSETEEVDVLEGKQVLQQEGNIDYSYCCQNS